MAQKIHPVTLKFINYILTEPDRTVKFLGYRFKIKKGVFPLDSPFSHSSKTTARRLSPKKTDEILDVGTGTGVQAIIAAKRGAKRVVAIDIDKKSLKCAKENVKIHRLENIVEVRKSSLFGSIKKNEKFDLIISQLPFADVDYRTRIGRFLFDKDYKLHDKFLREAKKHLKQKGRIMIPSGTIANEQKLLNLIKKYKYKTVKVDTEKNRGLVWKVYILSA